MSEPIISVSGLRGIVGESLTPEVAVRYAAALAGELEPGPIVLARDGRTTGPLLCDAVRSALVGLGRVVIDADVAATPTVGILVRAHQAAGGVQVSASHNPPEYNGIKLFSAAGRVLDAAAGERIAARYRNTPPQWLDHARIGHVRREEDTLTEHCRRVEAIVDVERIRGRAFRVLLDSNHGAGSLVGRRLLESLGCRLTLVGGRPDGHFDHAAEPTAGNLAGLFPRVRDADVNVAFCQDPDADRLAVIDEGGRYLGEESTLALCVDHVLRGKRGPIVINCATSRMSADLAERYGVPLVRTAVGEAHVVDAMLREKAVLGGEGNGGVIDPRVVLVRDSFVGMALILDAMAARQMSVGALADELPQYAMQKSKIPLEIEKLPAAFTALERRFRDAEFDRLDGLRFDWPDRWLLIRPSNTEPILRAIAEAPTPDQATTLCRQAAEVFSSR